MKITYDSYPDYYKCLCKLANHWSKRSSFPFDELRSEADMAFINAVDTFDSSKACFHTHLFITVNGKLRNYVRRDGQRYYKNLDSSVKRDDEGKPIEFDAIDTRPRPDEVTGFKLLVENLSKEAKEVVETVLNTPLEMIELVKEMARNRPAQTHLCRSNVTRFFKDKGWSMKQLNSCYSEIKSTFN